MVKLKLIACLWIVAGIVPLACVVLGGWILQLATHRPSVFEVEPGVGVMHALLAAGPFLVLAVMAPAWVRTKIAGVATALVTATVTGCVVTAVLWTLFYDDAYVYWRDDLRTGANIGLGLLMLASPLLVGAAMTAAYRLSTFVATDRSRSGGLG